MTGSGDGDLSPVRILRAAIQAGIDPLPVLARFRVAQERFHAAYARQNPVSCERGCSSCCTQMVFDLASAEVEDIGQHLRRNGRAVQLLGPLKQRRDLYDEIHREHPRETGEFIDDWIERVARAFWARSVPCVFLDGDGGCSIYEHRPQSCRRFLVHGPAEFCTADQADHPERQAKMVEPGEQDEVDELLQVLGLRIAFDPEDDRMDHALVRWLENRSAD
ncbi:hypothetical protein DRQ32_05895 [bacterium]|nr:MAG: hypothetical protein DRQ32_05895 [bacterium]